MDWVKLFQILGGTTLVSLVVTTCFNSIKNLINKKKARIKYLEEKEETEIKRKENLEIIKGVIEKPLNEMKNDIQTLHNTIDDLNHKLEKSEESTTTLKLGTQALLRAQLYELYGKWHDDKGYAPLYAKENFDNCYQKYHTLGANGVMDKLYDDFMNLPTEKEFKRNYSLVVRDEDKTNERK